MCVSGSVVDEGGVCDASHISQIVCCHQNAMDYLHVHVPVL